MSSMEKINDIHVHLGPSSVINQKLLDDDLLKFRENYGINHIGLMTLDVDIDKNNLKIIQLAKKHDFIHGHYWIQKHRIENDVEILKKEIGSGVIGVKFHGVFENLPISAEQYIPILEVLNQKKAVLLVHCGRYKDGHRDSNSSYLHGIDIAEKFPHIKVILAHMGGNDTSVVKKAIQASENIPNISLDTSGISTPYRVEYAVEKIGAKRIIFGSDYPWCSFRGMYYGVEDALIDKNEKDLILRKNFLNLIEH